jgi:hypothetical protein
VSDASESYEIAPYTDAWRDSVLRLRTTFAASISPAWNDRHFRWQQEENPWFDGHRIQLALQRGAVVGMRVLHAAAWEAGKPAERFLAPCYAGTVIERGHRSRGLVSRLSRAMDDDLSRRGIPFAFNLNAGPVTHVSALAEGWRSLGGFAPVLRPAWRGGPRTLDRVARVLRRTLDGMRPARGLGIRISAEPRVEEMAALAALHRGDGRVRHVRDERWVRWRFRDPSSAYRFVYLQDGRRLRGYFVLHHQARPLPHGPLTLVDWELEPDVDGADMLRIAARLADRWVQPVAAWAAALPAPARAQLGALGFRPSPVPGALADRRPTFLIGRVARRAGDDAGAQAVAESWSVGGTRVDALASWDLRPVFADPY